MESPWHTLDKPLTYHWLVSGSSKINLLFLWETLSVPLVDGVLCTLCRYDLRLPLLSNLHLVREPHHLLFDLPKAPVFL